MHSTVDLIRKKRDGGELTRDEIAGLVRGFTDGAIPDYQISAWLMAVCLRGMTDRETTDLTLAMAASGQTLDLGSLGARCADKHSTGGVGDKTTLIVAPLVAACGVPIAKLSGRGLGFSGGTLDKLESIPSFRAYLSGEEFVSILERVGLVVAGQSADLAPADGRLYALRDVTGTIESIPLIASSVMSKKLAAGARSIVLDVKYGRGAFVKTLADARWLAETMVEIGRRAGRRMGAVISSMEQPLGRAVGNALEVREAISTLRGDGPADLVALCRELAAQMLLTAEAATDRDAALARVDEALGSGRGFAKFVEFVGAQGGDVSVVERPERLPRAPIVQDTRADVGGYVQAIDAESVGLIVAALGAGRMKKGDPVDPAVGIVLRRKVGDQMLADETLAEVHARTPADAAAARARLAAAIRIGAEPVEPPALIGAILAAG